MLRLIETLQVGPRHAGHSRAIYGGDGLELWHETRIPWNPFQAISERVSVFMAELPATPPAGCSACHMAPAFYSDGEVPLIEFEGPDALERAADSLGLAFN